MGSHLLDFLVENTDWELHGLIRWRSSLDNIENHISLINEYNRIRLHYGDIRDICSLESVFSSINFDIVFHLAAQSYPKTSFDSADDTFITNINGTRNIMECCKKYCPNATIHNCSSSEVFGRVPKEYVPIKEDTPFHPASPYAISKCTADLVGRYYAEAFDMNVLTTRMFTHTGPRRGDVFMESTFAKQIALAENGYIEPVILTGNLASVRTIADVRDAVRAYYLLVTTDGILKGSCFNIGGDFTATVGEILSSLMKLSTLKGLTSRVAQDRLRPIDADLQIPDTSKFRKLTDWKPIISFETTMSNLLDYWRERVSRSGNVFLQR
ncbi:GDP-mannose 4,6-dehydratase [Cyanobium sp. Alchichica 3B3-8F6]|nr:GDP-mannose 4,6-dehydratase [Cyanobium sp. Alchichica 3B3-8F6]